MPRIKANLVAYNAALSACEVAGEWQQGLHLLEVRAESRFFSQSSNCQELHQQKLSADLVTLNALLGACSRVQRWEEAMDLLRAAQQSKLSLNIFACSTAISTCEKANEWRRALEIFAEVKALNLILSGLSSFFKLAFFDSCKYLLADCRSEQGHDGTDLLEEVPSEIATGLALSLLADCRHLDANIISFSATISALEKCSQWAQVLELLRWLPVQRLQPNLITYNAAISACRTHWPLALHLFHEVGLVNLQRDSITYYTALSACEAWTVRENGAFLKLMART
ncbi:unnamed protein product [Durusdinium trenchii]|uniref:Uncharacterized protein n=1 Tax=Durusdinium trenchii TaxID=1381693 RepID=A0ABP0JLF5_9DINO